MRLTTSSIVPLAMLALVGVVSDAHGQGTCPQSSETIIHRGTPELEGFAAAGAGGVIYNNPLQQIELRTEAGAVTAEIPFTTTVALDNGCTADFNGDGWTDIVGINTNNNTFTIFRNDTAQNQVTPPPDWNNASYFTVPLFTAVATITPGWSSATGGSSMGCGDFNGDGRADFFAIIGDSNGTVTRAHIFRGNANNTFQTPIQMVTNRYELEDLWLDSRPHVLDVNGDGRLDFVYGYENSGLGRVRPWINSGGTSPMFNRGFTYVQNIPVGSLGASMVAYADFTRDGVRDLAVGSETYRGVLIYNGISGGGFDITPDVIVDSNWPTGSVGARAIYARDYDLDGYTDLLAATNGKVFVWVNKASTFISGEADVDESHQLSSAGIGYDLDYDRDPTGTYDFLLNGNATNSFVAFANRVFTNYVDCADVTSDVVALGIAGAQYVVNSARLNPTESVPSGTTMTYWMSTAEPPDWQLANPCVSDPSDYCVTFPQQVGQSLRWMARMCSNAVHTLTPAVSQVEITADYTEAPEHYRSSVVVNNGVAYLGGFEQPGDAGHFYAMPAALDSNYWDAADKLNDSAAQGYVDDSARKVFTAAVDGTTQLKFQTDQATDPVFQEALGVGNDADALAVVNWWRGARFGNATDGMSKLGSIMTAAPAILSAPARPYYYGELQPADKSRFDQFATTYRTRPNLIMIGAKDGAIHAFRQDLTDPTSAAAGSEAWAYIPRRVAANLFADYLAGTANNFPDASATLADVKINGNFVTMMLVGSGNGGKGFDAFNVTDTVQTSSTSGPTPMWNYVPGGSAGGQSHSKPAVIRVKIGTTEKFYAVMASGVSSDNAEPPWVKGLDVEAVDVATGLRAWRFRALCPVTTDVAAFETDDDLEPGSPAIDGYVDRVIFADWCGNVYKLDPQKELLGDLDTDGWNISLGSGTGGLGGDTGFTDPAGNPIRALFQTTLTDLGEERPIAGTIGMRPVTGGRLALFFGTGGIESYDPLKANMFFTIYADDGTPRFPSAQDIRGACAGPGGTCEKFYGGVVVTPEQVLITKAYDPPIVQTGVCEFGASTIVGLDITDFSEDFAVSQGAAVVSSLYGDQGAIYATSLAGEVIRVGTPGQTVATATPPPLPPGAGGGGSSTPVKRRTWREVLY